MVRFRKAVLIGAVLFLCVGCDQTSKVVARNLLAASPPTCYIGGTFCFEYAANTGAFLGLGGTLPASVRFWMLIVAVSAALVVALRFVWVSQEVSHPVSVLGISLMIGGGLSNLLDRLVHNGAVVDYMHMGVGWLRTGVFNLADVAIMAGPGVLLVWHLLSRRRAAREGAST